MSDSRPPANSKALDFVFMLALGFGVGCEPSSPPTPLAHEFEVSARLGSLEGETSMLTSVVQAEALSDGRIVVLDRSRPFVRVFSRDGQTPVAFLEQGGGPSEARHPYAIAVVGNDQIAVADYNGISLFTPDGKYLSRTRLPRPAIDIAGDCNGRLLAYGPMTTEDGSIAWLTAFDVDSTVALESLTIEMRDVRSTVEFGYGKRVLAADETTVALIHENAAGRPIQVFSCQPGMPGLVQEVSTPIAPEEIADPRFRSGIREGTMFTGGIAVANGHVYWREAIVRDLQSRLFSVELRTLEGDEIRTVTKGHLEFTVLGRYQTGLLLGVDDPFPRVLITTLIRHAGNSPAHNTVALDSILSIL